MLTLILPQNVIDDLERERKESEERERRAAALIQQRYGVGTRHHYDESTDTLVVERVQDAEPALEFAQAMRCAHPRNGYSEDRAIRHVAEVPLAVWEDWVNKGMDPRDNRELRKRIEDADFSRLRTVDKL